MPTPTPSMPMAAPATCEVHLVNAAAPSLVLDETDVVVVVEAEAWVDAVDAVTGQSSEHGKAEVKGCSALLIGKTGACVAIDGFGTAVSSSGFRTPDIRCIIPFAMRMSGCTI